jgi:hypothetical protein
MMNTNDRRIYLTGARSLVRISMLGIAGFAAGALLAGGFPMLGTPDALRVTESTFLRSGDNRDVVEPVLETSAASVVGSGNMNGGVPETGSAKTNAPVRRCRRPTHWRRAASLPASLEDRDGRTGTICEVRKLQMGPIGRLVRYCHF